MIEDKREQILAKLAIIEAWWASGHSAQAFATSQGVTGAGDSSAVRSALPALDSG